MPKVVVSIVSWNHARYLFDALSSVMSQTYQDVSVVVVDNASSDETPTLVRERFPQVALLRNTRNLGFCRAHNQVIEYVKANFANSNEDVFVLVMNPDIILADDYIEWIMDRMAHRTDIGSATGKILRVYEVMDGDLRSQKMSNIIDSTGLKIKKSRCAVDRNSGEKDSGDYARTGEVFGVSGALGMYRLSALQDVAYQGKYFDEDFFAYKEDVDLAWRLRLRGWKSLYIPSAIAHHYRHLSGTERKSWLSVIRGRRGRSKFLSRLSYRNHFLTVIKNDYFGNYLIDLPRIFFFEFKKTVYLLLFEPTNLFAVIPAVLKVLPATLRKRKYILSTAKLSRKEIRKWFE